VMSERVRSNSQSLGLSAKKDNPLSLSPSKLPVTGIFQIPTEWDSQQITTEWYCQHMSTEWNSLQINW
jgi:hypothetical protein